MAMPIAADIAAAASADDDVKPEVEGFSFVEEVERLVVASEIKQYVTKQQLSNENANLWLAL